MTARFCTAVAAESRALYAQPSDEMDLAAAFGSLQMNTVRGALSSACPVF